MFSLPHTSQTNYITGRAALNVPNEDGTFADWHFDQVFLSGRGKIRIAGQDTPETSRFLGGYGIRECSNVLRRYGVPVQVGEKVYVATHIRALLDMVLNSLAKNRIPQHVAIGEMLDSPAELEELRAQIEALKQKINDQTTLSLLTQWEQKQV